MAGWEGVRQTQPTGSAGPGDAGRPRPAGGRGPGGGGQGSGARGARGEGGAPGRRAHLAHVVLAHGRHGPEHQLLAADAPERLLHLAQELLKREHTAPEASWASLRAGPATECASAVTADRPGRTWLGSRGELVPVAGVGGQPEDSESLARRDHQRHTPLRAGRSGQQPGLAGRSSVDHVTRQPRRQSPTYYGFV